MIEAVLNISLLMEVVVRYISSPKMFLQSTANKVDLVVTVLCVFLLGMLIFDYLSSKNAMEATILDSFLMIIRNVMQLFRIAAMLKKNRGRLRERVSSIDFSTL